MVNYCKALILLSVTIAAAILTCDPNVANAQTIGSVQLINALGERVTIPICTGPDGDHRGPGYVDFPGFDYFQFQVNALSRGWSCDFEWVNSAEGGRKFTANVLVWQGMLRSVRADVPEVSSLISVVPCIDCIWKIQKDGFYRADDKNHASFQLMARWN